MDKTSETLSVFFEDPFWIGIFERVSDEGLSVSRVVFGAEPKDCEVYEFILKKHSRLRFSPVVGSERKKTAKSPKRQRREARKKMDDVRPGTKAQLALKLQREQTKTERRTIGTEEKRAEAERKFALRQQKRKEKHRGK